MWNVCEMYVKWPCEITDISHGYFTSFPCEMTMWNVVLLFTWSKHVKSMWNFFRSSSHKTCDHEMGVKFRKQLISILIYINDKLK